VHRKSLKGNSLACTQLLYFTHGIVGFVSFFFLWIFTTFHISVNMLYFFHNKNANHWSNCYLFQKATTPTISFSDKSGFLVSFPTSLHSSCLSSSIDIHSPFPLHWCLVCAASKEVGVDGMMSLNGWKEGAFNPC
jgi:hypothetical protein